MQHSIPEIGDVLFVRTKRSRTIKISVRPFRAIRVSYPLYVSQKEAHAFLSRKKEWVLKNRARMQSIEKDQVEMFRTTPEVRRTEADLLLRRRTDELAYLFGFSFNAIVVRRQKTLWGSCSAANTISLNQTLVRLPSDVMDYVIVHELVHTRIKNHSKYFWEEVERCIPGAKILDKKLKKYSLGLACS
jgi:predicted metal-dependent hydrolase